MREYLHVIARRPELIFNQVSSDAGRVHLRLVAGKLRVAWQRPRYFHERRLLLCSRHAYRRNDT